MQTQGQETTDAGVMQLESRSKGTLTHQHLSSALQGSRQSWDVSVCFKPLTLLGSMITHIINAFPFPHALLSENAKERE